MTGVLGAAGCVAALLARQFSGQGCEIDLSLQEGVAAVMPYELAHAAYHEPKKREFARLRADAQRLYALQGRLRGNHGGP